MKILSFVCVFIVNLLLAAATNAQAVSSIQELQTRWAEIKYSQPKEHQEKAFKALVQQAEQARLAHPQQAEYFIWEGIIRGTSAGAKGGLGALDQVKQAKKLFEQAIAREPGALQGSAYTSLGSLYYQVPSWPVGFGDDDKAEKMLLKGLDYNPEGIDSNFFYGDYLLQQKRYGDALRALEKALKAPARPGRELADSGRREEVAGKIAIAKAHLKHE